MVAALPRPALGQSSSSNTQIEGDVIAREKELVAAERKHDVEVFRKLLRDDLVYVVFNGWVFTKSDLISKMSYIDVSDYDPENFKVRVPSHDIALLTYDLKEKVTVAGRHVPQKQYVSSLGVRHQGTWQLLFHQATPATHPSL